MNGSNIEAVDWSAEFPSEQSPGFQFQTYADAPPEPLPDEVDWLSMFPSEASLGRVSAPPEPQAGFWSVQPAMPRTTTTVDVPAVTPVRSATPVPAGKTTWRHGVAAAAVLLLSGAGFVASSGAVSRLLPAREATPPAAPARVTVPPVTPPLAAAIAPVPVASAGAAETVRVAPPPPVASSTTRQVARTALSDPPVPAAVPAAPPGLVEQVEAAVTETKQAPSLEVPAVAKADLFGGRQLSLTLPSPPPALASPPAVVSPPPPANSPLPAASASVAPPAAPKAETLVAQVLETFRQAYGRLDAETIGAIWPTANTKGLARAFDQLDNQDLTFDNCAISANGLRAQASCVGKATFVPRVGNKTTRVEPRHWMFQLKKVGDSWLIETVEAR